MLPEESKAKLIHLLNHLVEVVTDGEEVYKEAAEYIENEELKEIFHEESMMRGHMKRTLQTEVLKYQENPDNQGTIMGALERSWLSLKAHIGAGEQTLLNSLEHSEDRCVAEFEKALQEDLPADLHGLIAEQMASIRSTHNRIRKLRDQEKSRSQTA
jgi:uncharacterized protein (TIGR02284 family)